MIAKRKLSVADFLLMGETGVFAPDERVELIDGEVYTVSPPSSRHAAATNRLAELLGRYSARAIVQVQNPVRLGEHTVREPDIALLKRRDDFYEAAYPGADDVLLVVEVSITTLRSDRLGKLPVYARAGVPEVWILDVDAQQLEVYREPVRGSYRQRTLVYSGETVSPSAFAEDAGIVPLP